MTIELSRPASWQALDILRAPLPEMPGRARRVALKAVLLTLGRLVRVENPERLARVPEPAIFALNHSNSFESVLVPTVLMHLREGRQIHFLVDWMFLHLPGLGWLIRQCEPIPVYTKPARWRLGEAHRRERMKRPILDTCLERLAAGGSLGLFPEGTRNPDPRRLLRGRAGLGELVLRSDVPVVPVGIHYPAAARLGRSPRLGHLVLRVGEPLEFHVEREAAHGRDDRVRRAFARGAVARVMAALEKLSGKEIPS